MYSLLSVALLIINLIINQTYAIELVDTTTTGSNLTKPIENNKLITAINQTSVNSSSSNEVNFIGSNNSTITGSSSVDKSIQYLADRNKLIHSTQNHNDSFVPGTGGSSNSSSALNLPITLIIIVFAVVIVIIFIIVSALFVMRRRFSKWRLNIIDSNGNSQVAGLNGKLNGGGHHHQNGGSNVHDDEDDEEKKASLISNEATNDNIKTSDAGHTNEAAATSSVSQSTDSITIENEINKAIADVTVTLHTNVNENAETSKLLVTQEATLQPQTQPQQPQQDATTIEDTHKVDDDDHHHHNNKSTTQLTNAVDIDNEKQLLNKI